jgi:hypothetical protein
MIEAMLTYATIGLLVGVMLVAMMLPFALIAAVFCWVIEKFF